MLLLLLILIIFFHLGKLCKKNIKGTLAKVNFEELGKDQLKKVWTTELKRASEYKRKIELFKKGESLL